MASETVSEITRDELKQLRQGMLRLHKTLLDMERRGYERARGQIGNSYEFLQLVLKNEAITTSTESRISPLRMEWELIPLEDCLRPEIIRLCSSCRNKE